MELALPVFPHTRDTLLVEQLAIRLGEPTTLAKSLVMAQPAVCGSGCEAAIPAPDAPQRRVMASHPIPPPQRAPLLNPLMGLLAIRLAHQNTMGKSLVIPQAGEEANEKGNLQSSGEGANESLREFHINEGGIHA